MNDKLVAQLTCFFVLVFLSREAVAASTEKAAPGKTVARRVGIDLSFGELVAQGRTALSKRQFETAIAKTTAALQMKPDDKNASLLHAWRGWAYQGLADFSRAIADFTEAIRRDPEIEEGRFARGLMYIEMGEYTNAVADLSQVIRQNKRVAVAALVFRGDAYVEAGRLELARADYEQALRFPAKNDTDYVVRAKAHSARGEYSAAAADFAAAKRMSPGDELVLANAAWFEATCPEPLFRDGKTAVRESTKVCQRGKWRHPDDIDTLAAAYAETGDFAQAIKYQMQGIGLCGPLAHRRALMEKRLRLYQGREPFREKAKL